MASASSPAVLYILAATMFIGRLGPLTHRLRHPRPRNVEPVRYPTEQIVVGLSDSSIRFLYPQPPILESEQNTEKGTRTIMANATPEVFL